MSRKELVLRLMLICCLLVVVVVVGILYLLGKQTQAEQPASWIFVLTCLPDDRGVITFSTEGQIKLAATFQPPCQEEQIIELGPDKEQEFTTKCAMEAELGIAIATWRLREERLEVSYFTIDPCVAACRPGQWRGEYYANARFEGHPFQYTCEDVIDHRWTEFSPEGFSVRWTRKDIFGPTSYLFHFEYEGGEVALREDDGWFVDPQQVDIRRLQPEFSTNFEEGEHILTVEFSAEEAPARIFFDYKLYKGEPVLPGWQIETMTL